MLNHWIRKLYYFIIILFSHISASSFKIHPTALFQYGINGLKCVLKTKQKKNKKKHKLNHWSVGYDRQKNSMTKNSLLINYGKEVQNLHQWFAFKGRGTDFPGSACNNDSTFFSPFRDVLLLQQVQVLKRFWH